MNIVHLILTIITGGLWLPVWIICLLVGMSKNSKGSRSDNEAIIRELREQNRILRSRQ